MLSTTLLVAEGLSTGQKTGLVLVAAAFIIFALVSSFVLPKLNPNFPGRHVGWYVALCALFFLAMISAVIVLGKESKSAASTTSTPTTTSSSAPPATQGDPVAGKAVFLSAGCTGCHTLKAAGSTGTVGPNLDQLKPAYATVVHQVETGGGPMPSFKATLTQTQINDVAAFVSTSTH